MKKSNSNIIFNKRERARVKSGTDKGEDIKITQHEVAHSWAHSSLVNNSWKCKYKEIVQKGYFHHFVVSIISSQTKGSEGVVCPSRGVTKKHHIQRTQVGFPKGLR